MVTYDEFVSFSYIQVTQADFSPIERTASDVLSLLCRDKWDSTSDVCKKAVMYQIEYTLQIGGLGAWSETKGLVGSQSYSIGDESESVTYVQTSKESEKGKTFNGLPISPLAWALLLNEGILRPVHGVRVW